jgi:sugar lactone lactonase YvrE
MQVSVLDHTQCELGEGPLWHPTRKQLFWFDILGMRLHTIADGTAHHWQFEEHVSAAGWLDQDHLLVASETKLFRFNLTNGQSDLICPLEAENGITRSNDGRADPWGGFWIGTMGKNAEPGAGAIYRYHRGKVVVMVPDVTISNAICFAPDRSCAYYADTVTQKIMKLALAPEDGMPAGDASVFVDLAAENLNPDGAVVDAQGFLWNAQWGASRIARYDPSGAFVDAITFPARQISCPAFGGPDLTTLVATSAAVGLEGPEEGKTFQVKTPCTGQAENMVIL